MYSGIRTSVYNLSLTAVNKSVFYEEIHIRRALVPPASLNFGVGWGRSPPPHAVVLDSPLKRNWFWVCRILRACIQYTLILL